MRRSRLLLALLFLVQGVFAQYTPTRVDKAQTHQEVQELIRSLGRSYEKFTLKTLLEHEDRYGKEKSTPCKQLADSLQVTRAFYKTDFDKNGLTDLLVIGEYYDLCIWAIMSYEKDSLKVIPVTRRAFQECVYPKVIGDSLLRLYYVSDKWYAATQSSPLVYKDLVFRYGDFIEYNARSQELGITKIAFQTTPCFGTCPVFFLSIDSGKKAVLEFEDDQQKDFRKKYRSLNATIDDRSFAELTGLLNYSDFPGLEDNYRVPWTDAQTCILRITYGNGQVKQIKDYGKIGTYALDRIYKLLFDLRETQDWN